MKVIIIFLMIVGMLNGAYIEVKQNMKALYKGVELTEVQEDYILDNQDENIEIINKVLKIEVKKLKTKDFIHEKNVIEFILNPDGKISKIEFLEKSNDRKIDKITKEIIKQASSKFNKPIEPTLMRFIFVYQIGQVTYSETSQSNSTNKNNNTSNRGTSYQEISNGTTRFEHSSKEYIRTFETSKDGYINLSVNPPYCMERATLLTKLGQRITAKGMYNMAINEEVARGQYKILLKTRATCNVNLLYP